MSTNENQPSANFIRQIIHADLKDQKYNGKVATRFPPEPNGYLHIGHAKSICLNFGIAAEFNGTCNLRFDDTNPEKENIEYMESIERDVQWLGFEWAGLYNASDYFEQLYNYAVQLIEQGLAYVDSLSAEQIRLYRGTLTEPGKESPDRNRSIPDNLDLFQRMRAGEFADGQYVLRAKIDMASPNINMRDPAIYRIRRVHHHRTGHAWCIYPMYDYTHCISDAIEGITHSLCTLEFEDHRPLYDWVLDKLQTLCHPQQIEFARLQLEYTIVSKRKLNQLVMEKHVHGWDDPRMPTIAGLRRAGFTPKAIRDFCERIGVTKQNSWIEMGVLEYCIREDLNENALRAMAVLKPLRVVIDNYPEDQTEQLEISNHPQKPELGKRNVPFTKVILIEQEDFAEIPPPKFKRLITGGEVRLRGSYVIQCNEVIKNAEGVIIELRCTYDADTLGKNPEGRKVKGVIHWVSEQQSHPAEVRLYDRLFKVPNPDNEENFLDVINKDSLEVLTGCRVEASLVNATFENRYQFERTGYFCLDAIDSVKGRLVFNRTVTLREGGWEKRLDNADKNKRQYWYLAIEYIAFLITDFGRNMNQQDAIRLVESYYAAFNGGDMDTFLNLLTDDVIHDINQGKREIGKEAFTQFMACMNFNYKEQLVDMVIMATLDGSRASAEFVVLGEYIKSDEGLPAANGQKYRLPAGAFFEIRDNKVARITNYYNLQDWIAQVSH